MIALNILEIALPLLYAVALGLYGRHFFVEDDARPFWGTRLLGLTLALHIGYTALRAAAEQALPMATKPEFLSLLALSVAAVYLVIERRERESHTGVFFLGIALPFQLLASALMEAPARPPALLENPAYGVHVIFTVLGFTALAVGALYAIMYILLARQLRAHNLGVIFRRMPPLMKLEGMSRQATVAGIFLLGLGLGFGHFVALQTLDGLRLTDPKILLMDLAWLGYLIGFIVVKVRGVSGLRAGYLSLIAYVALMTTMVVSNMILSSFHSFQ